ncbi:MAG: phosphotransferase [Candidatus Margulisbacteria bacterium]|nr:phosphotransferase [Candidatus Margulisiibacteriota bacterium]
MLFNNAVRIKAPLVSKAMAANAGFKAELKVIGTARDGRILAVDDSRAFPKTSMVLFSGFLVPEEAETGPARAEEVVVKVHSPLRENERSQFMLEKEILARLSGLAGVPQVEAVGEVDVSLETTVGNDFHRLKTESNNPFFAMRKIAGRDFNEFVLRRWDKALPGKEEVAILAQKAFPLLAERLADIHSRGVVHRDIKPNNILFDVKTGATAVLDFGRANYLDAPARNDVGTIGYHAPELGKENVEDVRSDVYGLGATCLTILTDQGVHYEGINNIWIVSGLEMMIIGAWRIEEAYYNGIAALRTKPFDELLRLANMPPELKETNLGKYLLRLFHPDKEQRPSDMREIADNLRRLGAELDEHIIW